MQTLGSEGALPDRKRRIFAIMGQSNATGKSEAKDNTNTAGIATPYTAVDLRWRLAGANTIPFPWVTQEAQALAPRTSYLSSNSALGNMGTELTFGRRLSSRSTSYHVVKFAVNSSDLGSQWLPDSTSSNDPGANGANLFRQCVQFLHASERSMKASLSGIVWIQGENDAVNTNYASAYQANLGTLITRLRDYWPNIPVVIVKLHNSNSGSFKTTVRTAQVNYVAGGTNVALVDADDLALQGDNLHYTADGYATLGTRCADAMLGLTLPSIPAARVPYTIDATSGKAKPHGPWEWGNLMLAAGLTTGIPTYHLNCQDRTVANGGDGHLHDTIAGLKLTASGSPTLENVVAGWSARAAGFGGGTGVGVEWRGALGVGWDTSTQSVLLIIRAKIPQPASEKEVLLLTNGQTGGAQVIAIDQTNNGKLKIFSNGTNVASVNSHATSNHILIGLRYNRTATTLTMLSTIEKLSLTWHDSADGAKGLADWNGVGNNGAMEVQDLIAFTGTAAELTDAQVKSLYQALGETIPWT